MKSCLFSPRSLTFALILFASIGAGSEIYAQGGDAKLTPEAKPTPAPKTSKSGGRPTAAPTPIPPRVTPTVVFNQEYKDRLDLKLSGKIPTGGVFEDFILNAKTYDWLNFELAAAAQDLVIRVIDSQNADIPVARGGPNLFKINTATGGVPADGEYRLRVEGKTPAQFSLTVKRLGLTVNIFNERFNKIYSSIRESDPATIDAAIRDLETLAIDDNARPTTYEQLGMMYLYNRRDYEKAEQAYEQAIKRNGAGVIKITFDSQWRNMAKLKSGKLDWEDSRVGWLRIRPGQLILTDPGNRPLATVTREQIKGLTSVSAENYHLVTVTGENQFRPYIFSPGTREKGETDLVVKLIQTFVMN
jgi:hypothetical protein